MKKVINFLKENSKFNNLMYLLNTLAALLNFIVGFKNFSLDHIIIGIMFILINLQFVIINNYRKTTKKLLEEREEIIDAFRKIN